MTTKARIMNDEEIFLHIWFRRGRDRRGVLTYTERSESGKDQAKRSMMAKFPKYFTREALAYHGFRRDGKRRFRKSSVSGGSDAKR